MNYYFIDYENVHNDGFLGIETLNENDFVYLMYTEQNRAFPIEALNIICKHNIKLELQMVGTGAKNALDFQLSSYLGYFIAKNEEKKCKYYIVSKDTGYDCLIKFWKDKGAAIERIANFKTKIKSANSSKSKPANSSVSANVEKGNTNIAKAEASNSEKNKAAKTEAEHAEKYKGEKIKSQNAEKNKSAKPKAEKKAIEQTTKKELLTYLTNEEYSDKILNIINSYKSKTSISTALSKEFRDSKKSGAVYQKIKPLLKEKNKT